VVLLDRISHSQKVKRIKLIKFILIFSQLVKISKWLHI